MSRRAALLGVVLAAAAAGCGGEGGGEPRTDAAPARVPLPSVVGADGEAALTELAAAGVEPRAEPPRDSAAGCRVTRQRPRGGTTVEEGVPVVVVLDCAAVDWRARTGRRWELFAGSYDVASEEGCRALFAVAEARVLADGLDEARVDDCLDARPPPEDVAPARPPRAPERTGTTRGHAEGCAATFGVLGSGTARTPEGRAVRLSDCLDALREAA